MRTGLLAALAVASCAGLQPVHSPAGDPLNATYVIEDVAITLSGGQAQRPVLPGSAEQVETRVFGEPEWGDLDGDGDEDAALVLLHRTGGTGTFYYIAAAIRGQAGFIGSNAVLLGDRVAVQAMHIRNGVLMANYADRRAAEPMTTAPSVAYTKYLTLQAGNLIAAPAFTDGVQVLEGWITLGHEASEFRPCDQQDSLWLERGVPAFVTLKAAYADALPPAAQPYTPVFMTLAGRRAPASESGFGMRYPAAFQPAGWQHPWVQGNCRADRIRVAAPVAGSVVRSPLRVSGSAVGTWFFEGDFPVHLKDSKGRILASGIATAQAPWMTRDFVPFEATLRFEPSPQPMQGTLVLVRDNPSDDRRLDDAIELPVYYQ
jgi:hypothetical protein